MKALSWMRESGKMSAKNVGSLAGGAFTIYSGAAGYNDARNNGQGVVGATAQGLTDAFIMDLVGWKAYFGVQAVSMGANVAKDMFIQSGENARQMNKIATGSPFGTSTFVDSDQTYTMRQAGLTQIQNNMFNTKKAVMGNEAMHMHR